MAFFFAVRNGNGPSLRWTADRIDAVGAELHEPAVRCAGYLVPITSDSDNCGVFGIALQPRHGSPQNVLDVLASAAPNLEFSAPATTAIGPFHWPTPANETTGTA